ncbi:hypothetical protein NDU88_001640 [Pleurodeles waltl]|uniref:Uncharacterized protein n=1 Tax=Pleurodeles waltl TaxID=8319 RepID=A0AAV7R7P8_PLEWA|nr:hypothetical protein NDU88_001640 [Pleurodeles waltl]
MIVAKIGPEQDAQNVSWFKRFQASREVLNTSPEHDPPATEMDGSEEDDELEHRSINPAPNNTESICERQDSNSDTNPRDTDSCDGRNSRSRYHLRSNPAPLTKLRDFLL